MKGRLFSILACTVMLVHCSGNQPSHLKNKAGTILPCPSSPNCVSTASTDAKHRIEPIRFTGSPERAWETLVTVVKSMKGSRIVTRSDTYLHAEFTSALFRFVDDVECSLSDAAGAIAMRSASRRGYYDLGVNRKRMETIRTRFMALHQDKE